MKEIRRGRLEEEVRAALADILLSRAEDPRLRMVMVTRIHMSGDFGHARVYISVMGDEAAQEAGLRVLAHAGPFLRRELGRRLHARRVPELAFRADPGIRYSVRLQAILHELGMVPEGNASGEEPASGAEDEGAPSGPGEGD